jgi:hypothetical protein
MRGGFGLDGDWAWQRAIEVATTAQVEKWRLAWAPSIMGDLILPLFEGRREVFLVTIKRRERTIEILEQ